MFGERDARERGKGMAKRIDRRCVHVESVRVEAWCSCRNQYVMNELLIDKRGSDQFEGHNGIRYGRVAPIKVVREIINKHLKEMKKEIQAIWTSDEFYQAMEYCHPASLKDDLLYVEREKK